MTRAMRSVHCPMCGFLEDVFIDLDSFNGTTFACSTEGCEFRVTPEIGAPDFQGIQSASPEVSKQLGRVFTSTKQKNDYLKSKGLVEMPKGSPEDIAMRDHARNRADYAARKMGHRDEDARRATVKKEQAKGWTPKPGDGKVSGSKPAGA
jgi:hypothetical protein